jgi:hypothetical protein
LSGAVDQVEKVEVCGARREHEGRNIDACVRAKVLFRAKELPSFAPPFAMVKGKE